MHKLFSIFIAFLSIIFINEKGFSKQGVLSLNSPQEIGDIDGTLNLTPDPYEDLVELPSVKEKFQQIQIYLNSLEILKACEKSKALAILRERLITSIFHLNLVPEIVEKNKPNYYYMDSNYPYDPVYYKPFPKRPSLEALDEAIKFITLVNENARSLFSKDIVRTQNVVAQKLIAHLKNYDPYKGTREIWP